MSARFNLDSYVTVAERITAFYKRHPNGRLTTTILEHNAETGFVLIRAEVFREQDDALAAATGHAYELRSAGHVQQGSYVEVCETSAVGRALALLGFEVRRGVASREEMQKARRAQPLKVATTPEPEADEAHAALDEQIMALLKLTSKTDKDLDDWAQKKFKSDKALKWDEYNLAAKRSMIELLKTKAPKTA